MAEQALVQFRVDKKLKEDVANICELLGTDMPTVFRMCMRRMIIEGGIPFSTKLPPKTVKREEALTAFEEMRKLAADVPELTLEEINEEIKESRKERKKKNKVRENV